MRGNSPAAWIRDAVCYTPKEAEEGRLNVLVGADPANLAEVTRSASSLLGNNPSSWSGGRWAQSEADPHQSRLFCMNFGISHWVENEAIEAVYQLTSRGEIPDACL
jgi:hypothetical protein